MISAGAKSTVDFKVDEYRRLARRATKDAWVVASKRVRQQAKDDAPRSDKHRWVRKYPSGWSGRERRIAHSLRHRVRVWRDTGNVTAVVRVHRVGYSVFQEHGWTTSRGTRIEGKKFLSGALAKVADQVIGILRQKWPR